MGKPIVASLVDGREPSWEELLGSNNWEGLLDPLDLSLRRFLLRCGDFCECTYDAFNGDTASPYYGTSRYGEKSFFKKVKFEFAADYDVSSLLYATFTNRFPVLGGKEKETNYIGYVAVSNDAVSELLGRREIYVVWRGTETRYEWEDDLLEPGLVPATPLLGPDADPVNPPNVMRGWLEAYTSSNPNSQFTSLSAREQLMKTINQLMQDYKDERSLSVVVTGHSLGGALAVLSAFDLVENGAVGGNIPVAAVVFAAPRVGDAVFRERLRRYPNLKILHTRNVHDHIPDVPPDIWGYWPVGVEMQIDGRKSPALNVRLLDFLAWHHLQGMLHVVAGWHGQERPFEVVVKRSLALVNKSSQLLKDEYKIPGSWWAVENNGMVLNDKGDWVLAPPLLED